MSSTPTATTTTTATDTHPTTASTVRAGTVVVGIDGSEPSDQALTWAAGQAVADGRDLTVLHGLGFAARTLIDVTGAEAVRLDEAAVGAGAQLLEEACSRVVREHPGLQVTTALVDADPRAALLDAAERAAMLVVGSRGRGPVARLVLGSVSSAVSRHPACTTVVVRDHPPGHHHGVAVAVDRDGRSRHAVEEGFRLASVRSLPLTVVHCALDLRRPMPGPAELPHDAPGHDEERLVLDESVAGLREEFPDVAVSLVIGRRSPQDVLLDVARRMDLVVVGSHHVSLVSALLDQHPDRHLVTHAACVVVVVPEPDLARSGAVAGARV